VLSGCAGFAPNGGSAQDSAPSDTTDHGESNNPTPNTIASGNFTPGGTGAVPTVTPGTTNSETPYPSGQATQTGAGCDDCIPSLIMELKLSSADANLFSGRDILSQTKEVQFQSASDPNGTWSGFQVFADPDNSLHTLFMGDAFDILPSSKDMKELCEGSDANSNKFIRFSVSYSVTSKAKNARPSDPTYYDTFQTMNDPQVIYKCYHGSPMITLTLARPATDQVVTHGVQSY